ncbi:aspartyl protease family protein [Paenibacillus macerans]|uniref:aspartyl protease family protein n=1 Tax=Paenibacillus macerans TaxID=44252 RepID=UPI00203A630A|nr:aspartyl protease family protein [Paenibacillus macerans]MCM3700572.1 retropepsin-like domain-containing protein [Paenibacillus macerans]
MKINMKNGLPLVTLELRYKSNTIILENVLLDTGCAISVFDTDIVSSIGLLINTEIGRAVRMYGIGGKSELAFQQTVDEISINSNNLSNYTLQLAMTKIPYGFDAILGVDYFIRSQTIIDFKNFIVY